MPRIYCLTILVLIGCSSLERNAVPPLPSNGELLMREDAVDRLRRQTELAKDYQFNQQWEMLAVLASEMDTSLSYLAKAPDIPATKQAAMQREVSQIRPFVTQLNQAAQEKNSDKSLSLLREIHNRIRMLPE